LTVVNPSFEAPDGIVARGGFTSIERYRVLAADFADLNNASAVEVRDAMLMQLDLAFPSVAGSQVQVACQVNASTLSVLGGALQNVLQFPSSATGQALPGTAQGWTVTSTAGELEVGGFGSSPELPFESFESGWDVFVLGDFVLAGAFVDSFESGWDTLVTSGLFEAGMFSGLLAESFESGWLVYTVGMTFAPGVFGALLAESFETGWEVTGASEPALYTAGMFNDGASVFDSFEDTTAATHVVTVTTVFVGQLYTVRIDGTPYGYVAQGGDDENDVATELVNKLNADTQVSAAPIGFGVFALTPTPRVAGIIPVVTPDGPNTKAITAVEATNYPGFIDLWVGEDLFPQVAG
jgi:hypothetical protein